MFKSWIEENRDRISLYFRGKGGHNLKLKCPLCGKILHRIDFSGKFECKNSKCRLVYIEMKKWEIKFYLEPLLSIKYDLRQTARV